MSDKHVLEGVATHLRSKLSSIYDANNCKAMADGQPDPLTNDIFAAIHTLNIQGKRQHDIAHEELWSFSVTISKKINAVPIDRVAQSVFLKLFADSGLAEVVEYTKFAIQGSYKLIQEINNQVDIVGTEPISLVESIGYIQVPQLLNRTPKPAFRNEEWFHGSHSPDRDVLDGFVGLSLTLDFGDILKITKIKQDVC